MNLTARVLLLMLLPGVAAAQRAIAVQPTLPFDAPESWAMKYFTSTTLFTGSGPPPAMKAGSFVLGLEVGHLPELSTRQRTVGFGGTKVEDLNKLSVLVRPRITIGLPADVSVGLGVIPPIEINGVRSGLVALSIARPFVNVGGFTAGARVYGQVGSVNGDFTCPQSAVLAGDDPQRNPYLCEEPSEDRMEMRYIGVEVGSGYRIARLRNLTPHLLVAGNFLDSSFLVRANYAGITDRTLLKTHGFTVSGAAGLTMPFTRSLSGTVQAFYSPQFVRRPPVGARDADGLVNARFHLEWMMD
jgi:hypothetical protein